MPRCILRSSNPSEYGLVFPSKRDGTLRISELEAKLLFVQHLTVDRRYCFSVETPTGETYQQKGKTPISARVDLTLFGPDRKPVAHIELKAHNCTVEAIRKDLEKLLRERTTGMWFHTLHRTDERTLDTLIGKFKSAFSLLPECLRTNDRCSPRSSASPPGRARCIRRRSASSHWAQPNWRLFLVVGVLGGYTTFSSFGWETFQAMRDGAWRIGLLNVLSSVVLGYVAVWAGVLAAGRR